jgi:hypothetical protein
VTDPVTLYQALRLRLRFRLRPWLRWRMCATLDSPKVVWIVVPYLKHLGGVNVSLVVHLHLLRC